MGCYKTLQHKFTPKTVANA